GVFIAARGDKVVIEGQAEEVARTRDVLLAMHEKLLTGEEMDAGAIDALIAMADEPTLEGIITGDAKSPPIMIRTRKKTITPRSAMQADYMRQLVSRDIIFSLGPAGTGKTYLAVAQAISQLITGSVQRLILSRPAVEAGEKLGFLPGDMKEKVDPYLRPLYDALYDCMPPEQVDRRIASGEIEIAPIAFMRGRTLADAFVILDEAQNTTREQMKMFLTRFGQNSRMVVCGDPRQVDIPGGDRMSGLADAVERLEGVEGIGVTRFTAADVVRHPIVGRIVEAYEGEGS
ncbi:MAG: PhoH family protein, partial [Alteraurantiacibacter sp.]